MPYTEAVTKAGATIEVERYYSYQYQSKSHPRGEKIKPTPERIKKANLRNAEKKLRRLINANFEGGDYHLVLDYIRLPGQPDRETEEMKHDIAVFLRECRKQYKKAGLEFKYIHVMEIGEKGARHHHLVVNKIDTAILQQAWYKAYSGHNRIKVFPLDDSGNYAKLASYLIKYTSKHLHDEDRLQGKRWNASKNLIKPITKKRIITDRDYFRTKPIPRKGYYVDPDSIEQGVNEAEFNGYGYFRYTMVRLS